MAPKNLQSPPKSAAIVLALALCLLPLQGWAIRVLRLPWIFSDEPEISADFGFSENVNGKTNVEFSLGGRFSRFGLPRGAARAPVLDICCEFVSPGDLIRHVAELSAKVDLGEVLKSYGSEFTAKSFSPSSPFVYKTEFDLPLAPGDYNVLVAIRDTELSISSHRTLHVIVPDLRSDQGVGDLKICLGVGETLDGSGKKHRVLDPNPWRQVGGYSGWDLIVAYGNTAKTTALSKAMRRHSIWRLRGDKEQAVWQEESPLPPKKSGQLYLARLGTAALNKISRGIYIFKVEIWIPGKAESHWESSKTFEILP